MGYAHNECGEAAIMARPKGSTKPIDENTVAYKLALMGATDADLAEAFGVKESTINNWKKKKEGFLESIKKGKYLADAEVAASLFERATGYSHPEEKIFNDNGKPLVVPTTKHYPPDTGAAFIWLKNRQPDKWRDKKELGIDNDVEIEGLTIKRVDASSDKRKQAAG